MPPKTPPQIAEQIILIISYIIKFTLIVAIFIALYTQSWLVLFFSVISLILTLLPTFFAKSFDVVLPLEFEFAFVIFIYASMFLGESFNYYHKFWWWDIFLHGYAGIMLGLIGFILLYVLYAENRIKAGPRLIAIFSCTFGIALGTLWEIFEFGMDTFLGLNMQKSGLLDTMGDLIVNSCGALIIATLGYFYVKYGAGYLINHALTRFVQKNPKYFKKKKK